MLRNKIFSFLKNYYWLILFSALLLTFSWKIFVKGYAIGPFDFMTNYYHPFREVFLSNDYLTNVAVRFKNFLMSDVVTVVTPTQLLVNEMFKSGIFPLWNPYILAGSPLLANVQSSVLYPLNILFFLFNPVVAYNLFIILQIVLAFLFSFLYLRTLKLDKFSSYIGALSFSFSSFFITWLPWGTRGHVLLWLPLSLYSIEKFIQTREKKFSLLLLIALAFSFFAGHTQTSMIVFFVVFTYVIWKARSTNDLFLLKWILLIAVLTFFLIAPQLIPSIEMYKSSIRDALATISFYKDQTLNFSSYIQSIFPDFFGNPVTRNWWGKTNYAESNIYFGSIALYFAAYSLINRRENKNFPIPFFLYIALLGIILSTDNLISLFIFKLRLPLISSSTFARYSVLFIISGSVLSAFGLHTYLKDLHSGVTKKIAFLNCLFLAFFTTVWILIFTKLLPKDYLINFEVIKRNMILPTILIVTLIVSNYLIRFFVKNKNRLIFIFGLLVVIGTWGEYFRFASKYVPFSPRDFFYPNHSVFTKLEKLTHDGRYYNFIHPNIASMYRASAIDGSEPLYNERYGKIASLSDDGLPNPSDRAALQIPDGKYKLRVLDILTTKYIVDEADNLRNSKLAKYSDIPFEKRFSEIWTDGRIRIYRNNLALNRYDLFYNTEYINEDKKILDKLITPDFDYRSTLIIEKKLKIKLLGPDNSYQIKQEIDAPMYQNYVVLTKKPALFYLADTYYPGWHAYIDGKSTLIIRTNYAFRSVFIPAGKHTIEFKYQPESFKLGVIFFVIGMIGVIIYLKEYEKKTRSINR